MDAVFATNESTISSDVRSSDRAKRGWPVLQLAGAMALAGGLSIVILRAARELRRRAEAHRVWVRQDEDLDTALEDTFEASDAVAKY